MTAAEFLYSTVLRPRPLKNAANYLLRCLIPTEIQYDRATVVLNPEDPVISGALTLRVYERTEIRFIQSVCRTGMTFLDIGANVGLYTAIVGKVVGPTGRIVALEPDLQSFEYLLKTVRANQLANSTCVMKAAADHAGRMRLFTSKTNRGDNRLYLNELSSDSHEVEVITIDSLFNELSIASVDLVKIDVQGYEWHVLRGMARTIERSENLVILTEFWPHGLRSAQTDPKQFLEGLKAMGLNVWELKSNGKLAKIEDSQGLIDRYPGRKYTNIVATKSLQLF